MFKKYVQLQIFIKTVLKTSTSLYISGSHEHAS